MPKLSDFRITKTSVEDLPTDRDVVYFDSRLTGFGVRVKPNGRKIFMVQYRNEAGKVRKLSFGHFGPMTVEDARKKAAALLGRVQEGFDPAQEEADKRRKDGPEAASDGLPETVAQLCDDYVKAVQAGIDDPRRAIIRGKAGPKKASTLREDKSRIKRHIVPLIGKFAVAELRPKHIAQLQIDITLGATSCDEKTGLRGRARVTGGAGIASRTIGLLGSIMNYAVLRGVIDVNPCTSVKRPPDRKRKVRMSAEQYANLGQALGKAYDEGECWQALVAIWTIALTGCRREEVAKVRISELDFDGCALRLDDSKEGESVRPLGKPARDLLRAYIGNTEYVLRSDRNGDAPYGGLPGAWKRIKRRFDPRVPMPSLSLHSLRHCYASAADDMGYSLPTIGALLGHSQRGGSTAGYIFKLDDALISASDRISGKILEQMGETHLRPLFQRR